MTNKYIEIYYNIENYQIYFVNQGVFTLKTTKWMLVGALTLSLSGTILSSADAVILDDPTIYGGWSEDTGYFIWGFGTTQAISGWHPGDLGWVAKTYYGK